MNGESKSGPAARAAAAPSAMNEETLIANEEPNLDASLAHDSTCTMDVHGASPGKEIPPLKAERQQRADKFHLQEDIFALLFVSPVKSQAFLYSMFWFTFQAGVITLIACKYRYSINKCINCSSCEDHQYVLHWS